MVGRRGFFKRAIGAVAGLFVAAPVVSKAAGSIKSVDIWDIESLDADGGFLVPEEFTEGILRGPIFLKTYKIVGRCSVPDELVADGLILRSPLVYGIDYGFGVDTSKS